MSNQNLGLETQAIRTQLERTQYLEHSVPLYLTSSFIFEDTEDMRTSFAEKNAIFIADFPIPTHLNLLRKFVKWKEQKTDTLSQQEWQRVYSTFCCFIKFRRSYVSASSVFGSTHTLFTKYFPKWNITTSYFDVNKPETIENFIRPNTKIFMQESPTNPAVDILDLELLGKIAKSTI